MSSGDPGDAQGAGPARTPAEFVRQLRETADRIASGVTSALPTIPGLPSGVGLPALPPLPATLSARQLQAVLDDIAARRAQVQALQAQLEGFDQQLGALETSLAPLLTWAKTWAGVEQAMTDIVSPPKP